MGIDDTLAVHQLILLGLRLSDNRVIFCLMDNMIGFDDVSLMRSFGQRFSNVIQNVLFEYRKVELLASFAAERDSADFTFLLALLGLIIIIFWSARLELCDCVTLIQFVLEIAEIIAKIWFLSARQTFEDDAVRVKIQNAFLKLV